ncbi:acetyltransferase [Thraustotheca clavata]|uniref:Acetyltransferase n=1 Tax=Thraustotheca clavata TaxID=74557 RepID=A0A1V9ZPC0_9STRA|nr:acetyltransferase [Thraustotheca clavata]
MGIEWETKTLSALSSIDAYKILQLRSTVFILEQNSVVLDPDGLDMLVSCLHIVGRNDQTRDVVAYARILGPGTKGKDQRVPLIGRVVVAKSARGTGLGRQVMKEAISACTHVYPGIGCQLGAQAYLEKFYNSLGFVRLAGTEPYDEHGIPHIDMKREDKKVTP